MHNARSLRPASSLVLAPRLWRKILLRVSPLGRELAFVLALKFLLLWLLWQAFFSQPLAHHMRIDLPQIEQQLLNAPAIREPADAQR